MENDQMCQTSDGGITPLRTQNKYDSSTHAYLDTWFCDFRGGDIPNDASDPLVLLECDCGCEQNSGHLSGYYWLCFNESSQLIYHYNSKTSSIILDQELSSKHEVTEAEAESCVHSCDYFCSSEWPAVPLEVGTTGLAALVWINNNSGNKNVFQACWYPMIWDNG